MQGHRFIRTPIPRGKGTVERRTYCFAEPDSRVRIQHRPVRKTKSDEARSKPLRTITDDRETQKRKQRHSGPARWEPRSLHCRPINVFLRAPPPSLLSLPPWCWPDLHRCCSSLQVLFVVGVFLVGRLAFLAVLVRVNRDSARLIHSCTVHRRRSATIYAIRHCTRTGYEAQRRCIINTGWQEKKP